MRSGSLHTRLGPAMKSRCHVCREPMHVVLDDEGEFVMVADKMPLVVCPMCDTEAGRESK